MRKLKIKNKKVLLKITFRLRNKEEFSKIEAIIKEKEYIVEEFGEIDKNNFNFRDIEKRVNDVRKKYGINCKIALLSNIKDVLFASFRMHQEIIDEFIFFIDKINYNILNKNEYNSEKILGLVDIEKENINKKIYINIEFENFMYYFDFFLTNNNFKYFENVEKIEETVEKNNKNIEDFKELNGTELFNLLYKNKYFIVFYIVGLIRKSGIEEARKYLIPLFKYLQNMEITIKQEIAATIYSTKGIAFLEFKEKMGIFSLIVLLELPFNYILKFIMKTLLEDKKNNEKYYPPIISDILNYSNKNKMIHYKSFFDEFRQIMDKITESYIIKNDIKNKEQYNLGSKRIAFIVDSMYNVNYSVEKLTFDMVKNIKKYYPEYEIIIYVENNFDYIPEEKIMIHSFIGDCKYGSELLVEEHIREIEGTGISIIYSRPIATKEYRVKDMIYRVFEFNPEVIITTSLCSYSINLLYEYYPTVYLSMISLNEVNNFDVELYNLKHIEKRLKEIGKEIEDNMYEFKYGADFKKSIEIYEKNQFGIKQNDFVMVSIGVRLKTEMEKDFIDMVCKFLRKYKYAKWYLIGEVEFPIIEKNYSELMGKQIFTIGFENNLSAFFQMCNITLNPKREGGGFSVFQSIANDIPVINTSNSESGKGFVGEENCVKTFEEYFEKMERLMNDEEYYIKEIEMQKRNIEKYNYKNIIDDLMKYINLAKEKYIKRKNSKIGVEYE